jgi:hypothetical protein
MDSSVKSRPSYYELLGLRPTASAEEIARAFAREVGLFRPRQFGGLAEVGLAYETLRDPARRADYDASIGVRREAPAPKPALRPYITNAVFLSAAPRYGGAVSKPAEAAAPPLSPAPERQPEPVPPTFLATPTVQLDRPAVQRQPVEVGRPPMIALDAEDRPIEFNRTIAIGGALLLAVAVTAAWAGTRAGGDAQDALPKSVVTAAVPTPRPAETVAEPAAIESPAPASRAVKAAPVPRVVRAIASRPEVPRLPVRSVSDQNRFARESIAQALAEPASEGETAAPAVAASMPLPAATVARTIDRIGYSCGKVSSTLAGEAAGVFTVTCSSGQSFQARPVGGRYRFKRMGR